MSIFTSNKESPQTDRSNVGCRGFVVRSLLVSISCHVPVFGNPGPKRNRFPGVADSVCAVARVRQQRLQPSRLHHPEQGLPQRVPGCYSLYGTVTVIACRPVVYTILNKGFRREFRAITRCTVL